MTRTTRHIPSGERAAQKRAAIIEAARQAFLREGFGMSMDQIAAEAGVSKVTVYNHFSSKEELFAEVITEALEQALGPTNNALLEILERSHGDIRQTLLALARGWVRGYAQPEVLTLRALIAGEGRRFPELGRAWRAHGPDKSTPPLIAALSAQPDLAIPDMDVAVIQFYALVLYPHIVYSAYGDRIDDGLADNLIERGVDMFLAYYRAPSASTDGTSPA